MKILIIIVLILFLYCACIISSRCRDYDNQNKYKKYFKNKCETLFNDILNKSLLWYNFVEKI